MLKQENVMVCYFDEFPKSFRTQYLISILFIDDDECALGRHNCYHPQYECKNTKGSFRCVRIQQRTTTPHSSPYYRPTPPTTYSPRYPVASEPCPTGFQRNHLGACTGKVYSNLLEFIRNLIGNYYLFRY